MPCPGEAPDFQTRPGRVVVRASEQGHEIMLPSEEFDGTYLSRRAWR